MELNLYDPDETRVDLHGIQHRCKNLLLRFHRLTPPTMIRPLSPSRRKTAFSWERNLPIGVFRIPL